MKNITQIIEYRKSVIKHAQNKRVQKIYLCKQILTLHYYIKYRFNYLLQFKPKNLKLYFKFTLVIPLVLIIEHYFSLLYNIYII